MAGSSSSTKVDRGARLQERLVTFGLVVFFSVYGVAVLVLWLLFIGLTAVGITRLWNLL